MRLLEAALFGVLAVLSAIALLLFGIMVLDIVRAMFGERYVLPLVLGIAVWVIASAAYLKHTP